MAWNYGYTPGIWLPLFTFVWMLALAIYSGHRRGVPGALPFTIACLLGALWSAGSLMEYAAADPATKILWVEFQSVLQLPALTAMTCFALEYGWPGRWLTRRNLALLSIAPLLTIGLVLTNDLHHLAWTGFVMDGSVVPLRGPGTWILIAYGLGLSVANIVLFGWLFLRSLQRRWLVVAMVVVQVGARIVYVLEKAYIVRLDVPLDMVAVAVPFLAWAVAVYGLRILDPIPMAHRMAIAQMHDGVVVLGPEGRVASLNPAAERILSMPANRARGQPLGELLPARPAGHLDDAEETEIELSLTAGQEARQYAVASSLLRDWRGTVVGRLLLLHDVTEQRRAQAQILEQQWAQAVLEERELLAQELHDGVAQSLGFLNLQAQATQLYLQAGLGAAAQASLDRLAEVALTIQGETRELIGNLLTISLPSEGFCSTMRHVLAHFEERNGTPVNLEIQRAAEVGCDPSVLPAAAGVQLLRIVQEALANVRKHAGSPSQVCVQLRAETGQLHLVISDDGAGFDAGAAAAEGRHFGLQVMRQRAARVGGQLAVHSAPGQGTRVEVCVPLSTSR